MLATELPIDYDDQQPPDNNRSEPDAVTPRVLLILASVLERLVTRNDQLVDYPNDSSQTVVGFTTEHQLATNLKVFHGVRAPGISIPKYLERLYKYTNCSPSCFVVGYVYIDRLVHRHPGMLVVSLNVHRLLLTSLMVASKILDDVQYNNAFYARVGGVSNMELNRLELELLFLLNFEVTVSSPTFESYCWYLEKEVLRTSSSVVDPKLEIPKLDIGYDNDVSDDVQATQIASL